jgi:phage repressor protein C with HTH and peptisase S24 domain
VFAFDDALMVKAIERLLDGRVALKARNPSYREEIISKEDATRLKVFGRVIWRGGLV